MAEAIRTYLVWRSIVNLCLPRSCWASSTGTSWAEGTGTCAASLVAVLSYVPYIGTIAAGIPPVIDALLFVDPATAPRRGVFTAFGIAIFYICLATFEGYIIVPCG